MMGTPTWLPMSPVQVSVTVSPLALCSWRARFAGRYWPLRPNGMSICHSSPRPSLLPAVETAPRLIPDEVVPVGEDDVQGRPLVRDLRALRRGRRGAARTEA